MVLGKKVQKVSSKASPAARPLLKWAGGKRQLLGVIVKHLPESIDTYYEPFVGGGAVFFALRQAGRFNQAVLSDKNVELIDTYRSVRDDVDAVIQELMKLSHSEEDYYHIRSQRPRLLPRRAARMIYLNRTGYNGLYRVNKSGTFNVPFGRYVNPNICDEERLREVAQALQGVRLEVADFSESVAKAKKGDAIYFDPPYVPLSSTARFAEYHSSPFGLEEHERLAALYCDMSKRGITAVLSNSDTPKTRELYGRCAHEFVSARRNINSTGKGRGPLSELLVFGPPKRSRRGS